MFKAEKSSKFPKKLEIYPKIALKTLKICRRTSLGRWGKGGSKIFDDRGVSV